MVDCVDLGGRRIIKKIFFSSRRRHTRYGRQSRGLGDVYKRQVQGPVTVDVAASYLQKHPNAKFLLDKGAASLL